MGFKPTKHKASSALMVSADPRYQSSVIPTGSPRGSIRKNQDGFPITHVRNDPKWDGFPLNDVANDKGERCPFSAFSGAGFTETTKGNLSSANPIIASVPCTQTVLFFLNHLALAE